ncbi:MAG: RecQ family ATP-dependent DNA helicase [Bacteroidia bacterium]|jgi:ATP-dependent DNA helicase RecQ|nr:RecQ family ATP-dependent DNA helicase [Bacteroidia bacterium]OQA48313.1 MAG: ATP-dependent DNA helicase RecQ [Bacteroidetes bacterium ADurb.Bin302]HOH96291.1 ATP-dependent DNA helicase RecQ [Candidatus Enterocola sp.]HPG54952.1 ATP-dependent DNA helicase RecQ [Candidatus Enterocola sp.]
MNRTDYRSILKQYWGYDDFRSLQEDIVSSVGSGKDTLGLMPTGGGKSITFQVPALSMDGLCLVITPLIALMKDQVDGLRKKEIKAAAIYSGMSYEEIMTTFNNCIYGHYKFLYVSPERLGTRVFLEKVPQLDISMIAVDEAHCISQWGYDFRPAYLKIAEIRKMLPDVPVLALTATATPEVVEDIQKQLQFAKNNVFKKSFQRENLAYVVQKTEDKLQKLLHILNSVNGSSVVYVRNRKKTKEVADFLNNNNISADYFHAGLPNSAKDNRQERWKSGDCRVIVATNAFGMGIDKADVRTVIHIDLPDSIEAYFQEAGRAGRDGLKSYAVLLYENADITKLKKRLSDNFPTKEQILRTYEYLAYYYQVGVESAEGCVFDFNLIDFCTKFKLSINPTHSALKILELAGYIEYTEEIESHTRIMFSMYRDELYKYDIPDKTDVVMKCLLRSYTGLFADYVNIDEDLIAKRTKLDKSDVLKSLIDLSRLNVISYIPYKKTPYIVYTRQREHTERIIIGKDVYENRKERFENRIKAMSDYSTSDNACRSRILLAYFGEKDSDNCGICDFCLKQKSNNKKTNNLDKKIIDLLKDGPQEISYLIGKLNCSEETIFTVIRQLMDEKTIATENKKTIYLIKK